MKQNLETSSAVCRKNKSALRRDLPLGCDFNSSFKVLYERNLKNFGVIFLLPNLVCKIDNLDCKNGDFNGGLQSNF